MSDSERVFLPFDEGLLELPERGLYLRPSSDIPEIIPDMVYEQGFKPFADSLVARGFSVVAEAAGEFPMVFVGLTRSRVENMANVARAARMGAVVVVSGAKTDGVDSLLKSVKKVCDIDGVLSKSHGKVFWFTPTVAFDWVLERSENSEGFVTAAGMFSPDKVDKGSALLTEYFDGSVKGSVADLGAGWGYLASEVLKRCEKVASVDLYEAEHSALEAAKLNVTDTRAAFHWTDVATMEKPSEGYHAVICNPPFHQGRAAEPSIGIGFIRAAARILRPSGQLLMVANRQLPYEEALDLSFKHWEILHQDKAFKVVRARRPLPKRG